MQKRLIALDIGTKRIGIAVSDPFCTYAVPVEAYLRTKNLQQDLQNIVKRITESYANIIVCGMPLYPDGNESIQTVRTKKFIDALKHYTSLPIVCVDECFTSFAAKDNLGSVSYKDRKRGHVDSIAACYILEEYFNQNKKEQIQMAKKEFHEKKEETCSCPKHHTHDENCAHDITCEEEYNVVKLLDEEGKEHPCFHLATITFQEKWYAIFQAIEEEEDDENTVTILEIVEENGDEKLLPIENQQQLDAVFEEFCRLMDEQEQEGE